jgi:hypothetical protein
MSRTSLTVALILALAVLLLPGFLERWRRVRRAVGAVLVFWIASNLWGTALYVSGISAEGALRAATRVLPPLLLSAAWVYWDLRRGQRA